MRKCTQARGRIASASVLFGCPIVYTGPRQFYRYLLRAVRYLWQGSSGIHADRDLYNLQQIHFTNQTKFKQSGPGTIYAVCKTGLSPGDDF